MVFISFSFLYMSSDVLKIINDSDFIKWQSLSYINRNKEMTWSNVDIGNWDVMNLYFLNSFSWALRQREITNFSFLNPDSWTLTLASWWPIYFKTFTWSTIYDSWMVYTWKTISLSWNLSLENFWWFTNYSLSFTSNTWVILPYNYYKIEKTIWWTKLLKEFGRY